jgi:DNA-binding XRE family transcriptional regulator
VPRRRGAAVGDEAVFEVDSHRPNSTVLRRKLGQTLRQLRERAGLTQERTAKQLERARATIGRMEDGVPDVRYRLRDVEDMLELYGADDATRELVLGMAKETAAQSRSWWHDYTGSELPEWFSLYVTLEDYARIKRSYEPELVTGLLQTAAYAEEIIRGPAYLTDEEEIRRRIKVRIARQSVLSRPSNPLGLSVILNEAVLRRPVGSPAVMAEQLQHLLDASRRDNVTVRILPFSAGIHGGMTSGAFTLLDFPRGRDGESLEPPMAYLDTLTGAMYLHKPDEVDAYETTWNDLEQHALDQHRSREMITKAMEESGG